MTLDELIQRGWSAHEAKTDEVADSLEANVGLVLDDDGAVKFMNLVNHCIGDHAGDRARARRVCEKVLLEMGGELGPGGWLYLAVARHLADVETTLADACTRGLRALARRHPEEVRAALDPWLAEQASPEGLARAELRVIEVHAVNFGHAVRRVLTLESMALGRIEI